MTIKLNKESHERLIASIQRFFQSELDQDIGMLKSQLLLNFCLRELGPSIYNQAIADAQTYLQDRVSELDISCHQEEFSYWKK